jgi:hypothetical protein
MSKLRNVLIGGLTVAAVWLDVGGALALTFEDISGKWCGSVLTYTFAPGTLTVSVTAESTPRKYKIIDYQYADTVITVSWVRDDQMTVFTKFSEFSADDRLMVQLQNAAGPRREFRRCSQ